jgi:hypothetical protein
VGTKCGRRDLRVDPDRYQVCLGLALQMRGYDQHTAFLLAATATPFAIEGQPVPAIRAGKKWMLSMFELMPKPWALSSRKNGLRSITFAGRITTLKQKSIRQDFTPDERVYVNRMVMAIATAYIGRPEGAPLVLMLAAEVGEVAFARKILLPLMLDRPVAETIE